MRHQGTCHGKPNGHFNQWQRISIQHQFAYELYEFEAVALTKQVKKSENCDFDYDNQIITHEKYDAKRTYKKNTGYFPRVSTIGDKVVYVEGRDGNANVKIYHAKTLKRS